MSEQVRLTSYAQLRHTVALLAVGSLFTQIGLDQKGGKYKFNLPDLSADFTSLHSAYSVQVSPVWVFMLHLIGVPISNQGKLLYKLAKTTKSTGDPNRQHHR